MMLPSSSPYDAPIQFPLRPRLFFCFDKSCMHGVPLPTPLEKRTHQKQDMTDPPPTPLRPTRYAKRRRVEPIEASEPELEAVAVQIACETALLCHETVTGACLETCLETCLCTNPKPASSQVCKACATKLLRR